MDNAVRALSKRLNLDILALLSTGPKYPRVIARRLSKSEVAVVRALRELEAAGLVSGEWSRVNGKNVKLYRLTANRVVVRFSHGRVTISLGEAEVLPAQPASDPLPKPPKLVGRYKELSALRSASGVSFVWGPAGIGKTALAAVLAASWKGPTLWVNCHGLAPDEIVGRIALFLEENGTGLLAYGVDLGRGVARAARAAALGLNGLGALVVLDAYDEAEGDDLDAFLAHLDPMLDGSLVVATARRPPPFAPEKGIVVKLSPLTLEDSKKMLEQSGARLDSEAVSRIYSATGGIPALLAMASKLAAYGEQLSEGSLDAVLSRLIRGLPKSELEVLKAAAVFRDPPSLEDVAAVSHVRPITLHARRLSQKLPLKVEKGRIYVHPLLREYLHRVINLSVYHRRAAEHRRALGTPEDMVVAAYHYACAGDYLAAVDTLTELHSSRLGVPGWCRDLHRMVVFGVPVSKLPPSRKAYLLIKRSCYSKVSDAVELLMKSMMYASSGWLRSLALSLLAVRQAELGSRQAAMHAFNGALSLVGVKFCGVECLEAIMKAAYSLGAVRAGKELCTPLLADRGLRPLANYWLGVMAWSAGEDGVERLEESARLYAGRGDQWGYACARIAIGYIRAAKGSYTSARSAFEQALSAASSAGYWAGEAEALAGIAYTYMVERNVARASKVLLEIEGRLLRSIEHNPRGRGAYYASRAALAGLQGDLEDMERCLREARRAVASAYPHYYAVHMNLCAEVVSPELPGAATRMKAEAEKALGEWQFNRKV